MLFTVVFYHKDGEEKIIDKSICCVYSIKRLSNNKFESIVYDGSNYNFDYIKFRYEKEYIEIIHK